MRKNQTYYFITVFRNYDTQGPHNMRCWGFYDNFEDAEMVVTDNITDIYETIYTYAVIEEYKQGISNYNFERWFYEYNENECGYCPIEEPKELRHYVGFALG